MAIPDALALAVIKTYAPGSMGLGFVGYVWAIIACLGMVAVFGFSTALLYVIGRRRGTGKNTSSVVTIDTSSSSSAKSNTLEEPAGPES